MSPFVQSLLLSFGAATLGCTIKLIFMFGRVYERLERLEQRVDLIDREGCRRWATGPHGGHD